MCVISKGNVDKTQGLTVLILKTCSVKYIYFFQILNYPNNFFYSHYNNDNNCNLCVFDMRYKYEYIFQNHAHEILL